ncbi:ALF repeat-containing protein [Streptomyces calvus]|uniref:Uncharacterized protein n=1 Tax=Streptomyces calvus TaxID=67282 RepID=A0AA40SHX1_9ACTN|nr:ALF repeat-containing protein [Streptomyces calvus]MBA8946495.1 hypothetical protein [Streptomyces calvus]
MRTPRTALAVAVIAATTLALAAPALAAPALAAERATASASTASSASTAWATDDPSDLRVAIVQLMSLPYAGSEVKTKGREALNGTVDDMRAFLDTGYRLAQAQDDRVALVQLMSRPETTPEVREAAYRTLRTGDPEEMRWFLSVGQYEING